MNVVRQRFILIADDNHDITKTLSILLTLVGFDVDTVHDGRDVLALARTRRPDVLLVDIGLPGLNGFQVAAQFRSDQGLKDVTIIAISGYSPEMLDGRFDCSDFDHHLVKPVDFPTLLPLISGTT